MSFKSLWLGVFALALFCQEAGAGLKEPVTAAPSPRPPMIGDCSVFPADHVWNTPITDLPVDPMSDAYVQSIGANIGLHPDFGAAFWQGAPIGIPYNLVPGTQPLVPMRFLYADESDPGPYPFPRNARIEGGPSSDGDRHVLVIETDNCILYETWSSYPRPNGSWRAGSGAVFDLNAYALRPAGWTSADAAGLPIFPGLVRYEEVAAGAINHALRFTIPETRREYIWPARHYASDSNDPTLPPMGQRFRLKAAFDISSYPADVQVILSALKTYGMFVSDNGSSWYVTGIPDSRWNDETLHELSSVLGANFEAVDESSLMLDPDSGQVAP